MRHRQDPPVLGSLAEVVTRLLLALGTVAILGMLLVVTGNALSRQLLGRPIAGAFEIGRVLMPIVVLAGMAWTFGHVGHFRMSAVRSRLGPRAGRLSDSIQLLIAITVFGVLSYLLGMDAWESLERREYLPGAVRIPAYPTRIIMAIGAFGTALIVFSRLLGSGPPDGPDVDEGQGDARHPRDGS